MNLLHRFLKEIKIGSQMVSDGHPTYFIADIGANFDFYYVSNEVENLNKEDLFSFV